MSTLCCGLIEKETVDPSVAKAVGGLLFQVKPGTMEKDEAAIQTVGASEKQSYGEIATTVKCAHMHAGVVRVRGGCDCYRTKYSQAGRSVTFTKEVENKGRPDVPFELVRFEATILYDDGVTEVVKQVVFVGVEKTSHPS